MKGRVSSFFTLYSKKRNRWTDDEKICEAIINFGPVFSQSFIRLNVNWHVAKYIYSVDKRKDHRESLIAAYNRRKIFTTSKMQICNFDRRGCMQSDAAYIRLSSCAAQISDGNFYVGWTSGDLYWFYFSLYYHLTFRRHNLHGGMFNLKTSQLF